MDKRLHSIENDPDEVVWFVPKDLTQRPVAYCKEHLVPLSTYSANSKFSKWVTCPHDNQTFILRNRYDIHQSYVRSMVNRENLRDFKVVRIEASGSKVLAKERYAKDPRYFIETKLSDTAKGLEVMIQVGKRDASGKKVQLFVVPPAARLGFDSSKKDFHPMGLFTEVRAIFKESEMVISPSNEEKKKKS